MTNAILLVEDEENDAFFMKHAMKKAGILNPIRVARDGQQAIDYFKTAIKPSSNGEFPLPYLVLLDLKLPYVMGLAVLKWIRQQPELAPIVLVLSASSEAGDVATAYHLGANAYLVKPSDLRQLDAMVASIRDFWLLHNIPPSQPNLERVVARLAEKCREDAFAAPSGVRHGDLFESLVTASTREQSIQPAHSVAADASRILQPVEQRIIDTLKTSAETSCAPSL